MGRLFTSDLLDIFQMNIMNGRQPYLKFINNYNISKLSYYEHNKPERYPDDIEGDTDNDNDNDDDKFKDHDWIIKVILNKDKNKKNRKKNKYLLSMHNDVWEYLFNKIIEPITKHCHKILSNKSMKDTKYIFLVGGFSNSKYFQMYMKNEFEKYNNLSVVIPDLPGLCVVDGASRYGLNNKFV